QYRDVGGTAYLVADELSDPNWIGTHEFQSPGAVQFEIAPEFETYTVMHETTEPSNPVANTMRRFVLEDASGLPQMFLKDANGNNTQLGCRTTTGDPYAVTPTSYGCLIYNRAGDGDCKYNALYDDSPGVQAFEWVPVIGTGITGCPVE
ncbi:MAG: hypothetical protein GY716_06235, partial [bacterium]|nr:hypothetical protein [bacterium]